MFETFQPPSRRKVLQRAACGFGSLAFSGMLARQADAAINPLAAQPTHHAPRAKRVIFIFMQGGPSHVDTFDYKPRLIKEDGKQLKFRVARTRRVTPERVMKPLWPFRQYGQSGRWVSDLFPHMARHVDDLCLLQGMHTNGVAHGPATLFLHTGATALVRPSVGSWISYGLGTENENLPAFVTVCPSMGNGGPRNYSNSFLPAIHQGTVLGRAGEAAARARFHNVTNDRYTPGQQRRQFELLQRLNRHQQQKYEHDQQIDALLHSFELAYRMQTEAPGTTDFSRESAATLKLYGIGEKKTEDFGYQCLLARRLAEAGVRYVQITYGDNSNNPRWDQHSNMPKHADHALAVDKPISGLLTDLKQRGLLEDTLVWWGGEFGRNPFAQGGTGRDHNPDGFTVWLAGGGVQPGLAYGETDQYGHTAVRDKTHMHDLHATVLHLLGIDHTRLTHRYAGRDFRLTDVHGRVVHEIIS